MPPRKGRGLPHVYRNVKHGSFTIVFLQAVYRAHMAASRVQALIAKKARNAETARLFHFGNIQKMLRKIVIKWRRHARISVEANKRFRSHMARKKRRVFDQWGRFVTDKRSAITKAVITIQCGFRKFLARQRVRVLRHLKRAAIRIQKQWRGFLGRRKADRNLHKAKKLENAEAIVQRAAAMVMQKDAWMCWKEALRHKRLVKGQRAKVGARILRNYFLAWREEARKTNWKKYDLRRQQNEAARLIQSVWRGHHTRKSSEILFRRWRSAIKIQKRWRGCSARERYRCLCIQNNACIQIQKLYRGHKVRRTLPAFKIYDALMAARNGDLKRLASYFNRAPGLAFEADEVGNNVLHYACMGGAKRTAKFCLKNDMDPNMYNGEGRTALHLAIRSPVVPGRDELAPYLVDHGALLEAPDYDGLSPLLLAAKLGRVLIMRELLDRGADPGARDPQGFGAIHLAAQAQYIAAVRELLNRFVPPDMGARDGTTSLHIAAENGDTELAEMLLESGAHLESVNIHGMTPLMIAVSHGHLKLTRMLMERGANIEACDRFGRTPFIIASSSSHKEIISLLCDYGAMTESADVNGDTALHLATRSHDLETVGMLLRMGADPNVRNNGGDLPTHIAAMEGNAKIMDELIEFGGSLRKRNWENLTPVGIARMHGQTQVMDLLSHKYLLSLKEGNLESQEMVQWQQSFEKLHKEWEKVRF